MPHSYFVRITRPYQDISGLVITWAERAKRLVCYEHIGDETEKTHIHIAVESSEICKKQMKNLVSKYRLKGNEDWTFKDYDEGDTAMVYMTKGKLEPKYMKGYTQQDSDKWKSQWVERKNKVKEDSNEELFNETFGDTDLLELEFKEYKRTTPAMVTMMIRRGDIDTPEEYEDIKLTRFRFILYKARNEAFWRNKSLWTNKAMNDYKMLVYSYIFRHNISIPKQHSEWRKWLW